MQVELRNGDFDYALLQSSDQRRGRASAMRNPSLQRVATTFRAGAPQIYGHREPRSRRRRSASRSDSCSAALSDYVGSNYVGQIHQVRPRLPDLYAGGRQVSRQRRRHSQPQGQGGRRNHDADRHGGRRQAKCKALRSSASTISTRRRRSSAARRPGSARDRPSTSWSRSPAHVLPTGTGFEWTAMSYQEKQVGIADLLRVRPRAAARLFRAGRPVRELDPAASP